VAQPYARSSAPSTTSTPNAAALHTLIPSLTLNPKLLKAKAEAEAEAEVAEHNLIRRVMGKGVFS
jgi:hypothetical protein